MVKPNDWILLVEDDALLSESLSARLRQAGYTVSAVATGESALAAAQRSLPALVILDVGLPDANGFEVCRALQRDHDIAVIFLTGRSTDFDKIAGLMLGADDYMTKPFSLEELVARVYAVLRRRRGPQSVALSPIIELGQIVLDPARHTVTVRGRPVDLPPKEFGLLQLLMSRPNEVITINTLLDRVWGAEYQGDTELIYAHISWLRQKIEVDPRRPQLICTVHGVGYRFDPQGSAHESQA